MRMRLLIFSAIFVCAVVGMYFFARAPHVESALQNSTASSFAENLWYGKEGDAVLRLQQTLTDLGYYDGPITGFYGVLTTQAVTRFQELFASEILYPEYQTGTGAMGPKTRAKLNTLYLEAKLPSSNVAVRPPRESAASVLSAGSRGGEVRRLQEQLTELGFYSGPITGYFGSLTRAAVIQFQEMYFNEILTPAGLTAPSGIAGSFTLAQLTALMTRHEEEEHGIKTANIVSPEAEEQKGPKRPLAELVNELRAKSDALRNASTTQNVLMSAKATTSRMALFAARSEADNPMSVAGDAENSSSDAAIAPQNIFAADEAPKFTLNLANVIGAGGDAASGASIDIDTIDRGTNASRWEEAGISIESGIMRDGAPLDIAPEIKEEAGTLTLSVDARAYAPGRYTLWVVVSDGGQSQMLTQDFTWGVIVVNTDQSVYAPGDRVYFSLGVLTDSGNTVCDATLTLEITSPLGAKTTLATTEGGVVPSGQCNANNVVDVPDYSAEYRANEIGEYRMRVSATTQNGLREIEDSFLVVPRLPFRITRSGASRIYPPSPYRMTLEVAAESNFIGTFSEYVPKDFAITPSSGFSVFEREDTKEIRWFLNMAQNDKRILSYEYDAPDISPEIFKLGKASLVPQGTTTPVFSEERFWLLASDASGDVILLWDTANGAVPSGWTDLTTYNGLFPRAASTAGGTGGSDTNHTPTWSASSGGPSSTITDSGFPTTAAKAANSTHTHSWSGGNLTAGDHIPQYKDLRMIYASNPTSVPANAIGIFDTASLSSGWSSYAGVDSKYLQDADDNSTGGSASHGHSYSTGNTTWTSISSGNITDATGAPIGACPLTTGAANHTHTISAPSSDTASNNPLYVEVVFGTTASSGGFPEGIIAMFDNSTLPTGWTIVSDASPYNNRLLKGATSFGGTGGASTHNHSITSQTSSNSPCALFTVLKSLDAGRIASPTHNHTVSFSVSSSNQSTPAYKDIILAKASTIFTQSEYRWYEANNAVQPVTSLASENATSTITDTSAPVRLRMNVKKENLGATAVLATSTQTVALQYAYTAAGPWTNVGSTSAAWLFADNPYVTNGATTTSVLLSTSNVNQSYFKGNYAITNRNNISSGQYGEWDFSLDPRFATTTYYFRLVLGNNTALTTYTRYPAITVSRGFAETTGAQEVTTGAKNVGTPSDAWWNYSWQNRRKITFNNSAQASNLVNFPVMVGLIATGPFANIVYSKTQDAGQDIRFVDADNNTLLPYEIEKWDETGTSTVWVKIPQINASSATDNIWMYYGNTGAVDEQQATSVWDSSYKGVWHLKDGTTLSATDSTANAANGTVTSVTASSTGKIDGAGGWTNSSNSKILLPNLGTTGDFTLTLWAKANTNTNLQELFSWGTSAASGNFELVRNNPANTLTIFSQSATRVSATYPSVAIWHQIVVTRATNLFTIYSDTTSIGSGSYTVTLANTNYNMGRSGPQNLYTFDGALDEVSIASTARSADWISATYKTQNGVFNTYAAEEDIPVVVSRGVGSGTISATSGAAEETSGATNVATSSTPSTDQGGGAGSGGDY